MSAIVGMPGGVVPASGGAPPNCMVGDGEADDVDDDDDDDDDDDEDDDEDNDDDDDNDDEDKEEEEEDDKQEEEESEVEVGGGGEVVEADVVGVFAASWLVIIELLPLPDDDELVGWWFSASDKPEVEEELTGD